MTVLSNFAANSSAADARDTFNQMLADIATLKGGAVAPITLALSGAQVAVEGGSVTFTVTRGGDTSRPCIVDYTTAGTGANPVNAADHAGGTFPASRITIAAGATTGSIVVASAQDTTVEPDETGLLTITSPTAGVTISPAVSQYTFTNDDGAGGVVVFGPTATADTGYLDAGGPNYRIEGTIADTAWEMFTGLADSSGQPGFVHYPNGNSIRTSGAYIGGDGSRQVSNQWGNIPNKPTGTGVPFTLEVNGRGRKLTIDGELVRDVPDEGFNFANWVRFRTGGAARPSITITRL